MKNWGLKILSSILTFIAGTGAAMVSGRYLQPVMIQPVCVAPNITLQLPPPRIAEAAQPTDKAGEVMEPHSVSISPYEIKRLVDKNNKAALQGQGDYLDLKPLWEKLGIKEREDIQDQCWGTCGADIIKLDLDGKPGKETVLRLSDQAMDHYLIFKQITNQQDTEERWKIFGYIDAFTRWNSFDPYRLVIAGGQRWLAISETTGHGSGFGSYADTWYEVSERGVTPVLSYQTNLFIGAGANPMTSRKAEVLSVDNRDGITAVVVQSATSYEVYGEPNEDLHLWRNKRQATFIKGPGMKRFVFDQLHSEMAEKELDPNYGDGVSLTDEEFLKYNYRDLLKVADGRDAKRKEWLRNYLESCDNTLEKQSLQKALEGARP